MTAMIGFLGVQKDARGFDHRRWHRFRPTVASVCHKELEFDTYYLIHNGKSDDILRVTREDMKQIRPDLKIIDVEMPFNDAFEFKEALERQMNFVLNLPEDDYYINFTTGSTVHHVTWFQLVKNNYINAKIVQLYNGGTKFDKGNPEHKVIPNEVIKGEHRIIDFSLSEYDAWRQLESVFVANDEEFLKQGISTKNVKYNELISLIEKVALRNNRPFLIDGETGAGKTQLAKLVYELKKKKGIVSGDFKYLNCATLRPEQAASILFGHKKGAFTGAVSNRDGILKQADGGMLFLDEIGTLSFEVQGTLLHALEEKEFYPMGSDTLVKSNFTIVCGTNVDLEEAVERGEFRDDLLARINLWHFTIPSLRNRREDVEPNVDYELHKYQQATGVKVRFNKQARKDFLDWAKSHNAIWKRNFRDLSACIERMGTLSDRGLITEQVVLDEIDRISKGWKRAKKMSVADMLFEALLVQSKGDLNPMEEAQMKVVLETCYNAKSANEAAGILYTTKTGNKPSNPGSQLGKYLKRYGIHFDDIKQVF